MLSTILTAVTAILVFLLVIIIHEFGHFAVAKLVGIRVNEFAIGMGPKLLDKKGPETQYTLRAFPIGGYVAMEGEEESSSDPRSFGKASVAKRIAVVVAGAMMNFLLAIVVLFLVGLYLGEPTTTIASFTENAPAQKAGMELGDDILQVDGVQTPTWEDVIVAIRSAEKESISVQVQRADEVVELEIPLDENGQIGIIRGTHRSLGGAIRYSMSTFFMLLSQLIGFFQTLLRGGVGLSDVSGPVGIVVVIGQAASAGLFNVLLLLAFININVGFFNLLPIPALDGSKILLLLLEKLRGKPISVEKESMINLIGFIFLIGLLILVTFKDIMTLGSIGG